MVRFMKFTLKQMTHVSFEFLNNKIYYSYLFFLHTTILSIIKQLFYLELFGELFMANFISVIISNDILLHHLPYKYLFILLFIPYSISYYFHFYITNKIKNWLVERRSSPGIKWDDDYEMGQGFWYNGEEGRNGVIKDALRGIVFDRYVIVYKMFKKDILSKIVW